MKNNSNDKLSEIKNLLDDILWDSSQERLDRHIKELEFVYDNLSSDSKYKKIMWNYIDYYKIQEKSWVTMDEFTSYWNILKNAWLVKDRSSEELFRRLDEEDLNNWLSNDTNNAISSVKQRIVNLIPFIKNKYDKL